MPFCQNCGRVLAENETCNCTANAAATPTAASSPEPTPAPAPAPAPAPTPTPAPAQQPINTYVNVQQAPKKKKSVGLIIAIILIPILLIGLLVAGILAAILVPAMMGYVGKSKVTSANSTASSLNKSINSTLNDMYYDSYDLNGYYILSSKDKYNYNVPENFDEDVFYDKVDEYFSDSDKVEWFAVVNNGSVSYVASSESWKSDVVGTYPTLATTDGTTYYNASYSALQKKKKLTLTKLYNDAAVKVKEEAEQSSLYYY